VLKMETRLLLVFFTILPLLLFGQGSTLNRDRLNAIITSADNLTSIQMARSIALQNPQLLEEILFITKNEMDNSIGRTNAFGYLLECSIQGGISKEHFFNLAFKLIKDINNYAFPDQVAYEINVFSTNLSYYGYDPVRKVSQFSISEALQNLLVKIDSMGSSGIVSNIGILNSIKVKITGARTILEKKGEAGKKVAINKISAALNEIEAQKGKHLNEDACYILRTSCSNLIAQIESTD